MARRALAALALAAVLAAASAPDPCCLRVTPYHIQALAQRMAQRFQALEYRAQDLRGVFAAFQAVHGNVSHRLRYLEAEHAHLSEVVSRLGSRIQSLEEDKHVERYRQYYNREYRGVDEPSEQRLDVPVRIHLRTRKRREEEYTELPHLLVRLDQPNESSLDGSSATASPTGVGSSNEPASAALPEHSGTYASETVHFVEYPASEPESVPNEAGGSSTLLPFLTKLATAPTPVHDASLSDVATTPTPLWQLEETASALLAAMSESDENVADTNVPNVVDAGVSYWAPANETESLEELFSAADQGQPPETLECSGQSNLNCNAMTSDLHPTATDDVSVGKGSTASTIPESVTHSVVNNSHNDSLSEEAGVIVPNITHTTENDSNTDSESASSTKSPDPTANAPGCKSAFQGSPNGNTQPPLGNFTNLLMDLGNSSDSLMDIFSPKATAPGSAAPPSDAGGTGAPPPELSDAELQTALRELDALLQRPPASAPPPDPEKLLLKRALTLALAALERTSDACLKLVNFTADAFEGLAAAEA